MTLTDFLNKAEEYLKSKLPDVPEHTVQEIAAHLTTLAYIAAQDEANKVRDDLVKQFRAYERRKYQLTKKMSVTISRSPQGGTEDA